MDQTKTVWVGERFFELCIGKLKFIWLLAREKLAA
jgi:hypothetical protein